MQCTQVLYDADEDSVSVRREPRVEGTLEVNGKSYNVMTGENIIGRDPEPSSIVLPFQAISAEHARIDASPDGHTLCDMRSRNKTKLKEKLLKPYVQYFLADGDTISFADIKAVYHILPEEDGKANGDDEAIPETPARLPRSIGDKAVIIPETPDGMDTSGLDESFVPSSQIAAENTLKNMSTTSETSFVASSQPPPRPSTSDSQLVETPLAERSSSRLRSSVESQASMRLILTESLTDNDTPSRSLEVDTTNIPGNGRSIYEAETQLIAFSNSGTETPDKPDSRSNTPDLDESSLYGANTQIVFSPPDSFKRPTNRNVRKLSLAKLGEDRRNVSPDLGSANESIYEADTQLICPSDIDSPTVERGSENGTPGREESLYEANTQVLPSPKSHRSARKKVQFSVENGSDDGTPKRRNETVYAPETQVCPFSDVLDEVYEAETQVLPGLVGKDPASESEKLYEAETQVLPCLIGKDPASENENIHEAETQILPCLVEKDPASESEKVYEAETQLLTGSAETEDRSIYDAETQPIPLPENRANKKGRSDRHSKAKPSEDSGKCDILNDNLDGKAATGVSEKKTGESRSGSDDIYSSATQIIPRGFTSGGSDVDTSKKVEKKASASASKSAVPASDSNNTDAEELKTLPIRKKASASANKSGNAKPAVSASDSDDTDAEELQTPPIRKKASALASKCAVPASDNDDTDAEELQTRKMAGTSVGKARISKTCVPASDSNDTPKVDKFEASEEKKANDGDETNDKNRFNRVTRKITRKASTKPDEKPSQGNDSEETDEENIFDCPTQKIKSKAPAERKERKTSEANDSDETDSDDMFNCPTQKITPKSPTKTEDKKASETNDSDETDDENMFTCLTQKITSKVPTKTEDKKASETNNSEETNEENIFDCPTQKIKSKAPAEPKETKILNDSDETDNEDMFTCPTQKITPKSPTKTEDKKASETNDSDETEDENMFNCPTQRITSKVTTKTEDKKASETNNSEETNEKNMFDRPTQKMKSKAPAETKEKKISEANDSDETDNEDMFTCPTQKITLKSPTKTEDKKASETNDGDETDDENMFTGPTQKITPKSPTKAKDKTSEANDVDKDDIFNCPTEKIPDGEKSIGHPAEPNAITESLPFVDDNSNDSDTLLRHYKGDDEEETSQSPDLGTIGEAESPAEAVVQSRESTPDDIAASLMNDVDTRHDTPGVKRTEEPRKERIEEPSTERVEEERKEQIEEPSKERSDELCEEQTQEPSKEQREKRTEETSERRKEQSVRQTGELGKEQHEEHTEDQAKERRKENRGKLSTKSREERAEETHDERSEEPKDVVESAELPSPDEDKQAASLQGTGITRSKEDGPDASGEVQPEGENKKEMDSTVLSVEEDEPKRKRGRPRKSVKRTVTAPFIPGKSSQNDVSPAEIESTTAETLLQENKESESSRQERRGRPRNTTTPSKVSEQASQLETSLSRSEEVTEKPVERLHNEEKILPSVSDTPKPKRGRADKTSSQTLVAESKPTEKLRSAEKPVESDNEEDKVVPSTAESPRPKRGKLAKTNSQTSVPDSKTKEKLRQSAVGNLVEKPDNEEDKLLPSISVSPKPKRGKLTKSSSQTLVAESKPTEKMSLAGKRVESDSEEDSVIPSAATSPRPKRGKLAKTSSQTSVAESKPTEKLRQSSMKKPVEQLVNEDDSLLPGNSESRRPKRGNLVKSSSQPLETESKPAEKLRQSLLEKHVEKQNNEEDEVLPTTSESPRPKRGKQAKASSLNLVAESKSTKQLSQNSTERSAEKRGYEEDSLLPGNSPRPKRGKLAETSLETPVAESKTTEELSKKSTEKSAEKRGNEEIPDSEEAPRPKRGKFAKKSVLLTSEDENVNDRGETASTSTRSGIKRPSPQKNNEKRSKRMKAQETPPSDENLQKVKSKRQLYTPRGRDNFVQDSEAESDDTKKDDFETPKDEPSSEDIATRRSGRMKKPTWKIRGGDATLTKKFVLSYSQDTDDAAAESSEEESSVKSKGRGRPKKSSLAPTESRQKKVEAQPRTKTGRFSSRMEAPQEQPAPSNIKKVDVSRRSSKVRASQVDPEESDRESVSSEVAPGRRRRMDSSDSVQSTPLTRSSSMMSEMQSPSRRKVQKQPKQIHHVLFTGFADGKLEKQVTQLGAEIVENVNEATVAVTDRLRRTVKLLTMMARGQPIVSPDWITLSGKAGHFLDPWDYLLSDAESEKKFDFNMERSLKAALSKKLLDGYTVFVTKSVMPPPDAMEEIIKGSGGVLVKKLLPKWPEKSVIISCKSDAAQLKKIRKPPLIVVAEWLLSGVLQQRLDTQNYTLS